MTWRSGDLELASRLADIADRISMSYFRKSPRSRLKDDGSIVTEADEAVERALRAELAAAAPGDAILGEEEGSTGEGSRRWYVDPIDGTSNYASGIPNWATLIALEEDGDIVAGVASAPALGDRWEAARGLGARRNGEPLEVSSVSSLAEARLCFTDLSGFRDYGHEEAFARLAGSVRSARGFGDYWGHVLVAAGSVDLMVEPIVNSWDLAPLIVIVEEAGGRLTDLRGERRIDGGSALTTNGVLHDEALEFFRGAIR